MLRDDHSDIDRQLENVDEALRRIGPADITLDIDQFMANAREAEAAMNRILATGMHQCITCKWWEEYGDRNICLIASPHHMPINDDGSLDETPRPEPKVEIGGGPIYTPILYTAPDFGCVMWESLEDKTAP